MKLAVTDRVETGSIPYIGGTLNITIENDIRTSVFGKGKKQNQWFDRMIEMNKAVIDVLDHTVVALNEDLSKDQFLDKTSKRWVNIDSDDEDISFLLMMVLTIHNILGSVGYHNYREVSVDLNGAKMIMDKDEYSYYLMSNSDGIYFRYSEELRQAIQKIRGDWQNGF